MKPATVIAVLAAFFLALSAGACSKDKKASVIACLKEMDAFFRSDQVKALYANGVPDMDGIAVKVETIVDKHFRDVGDFESHLQQLANDPEVKKAREAVFLAMVQADRKYGLRTQPPAAPAVSGSASPAEMTGTANPAEVTGPASPKAPVAPPR
ncbi:MAG: hypothetical protein KA419_14970 [Acidobacteria bacterium]|nr:hypothetical protein [Acidobacteriota bacterium]